LHGDEGATVVKSIISTVRRYDSFHDYREKDKYTQLRAFQYLNKGDGLVSIFTNNIAPMAQPNE